MTRNELLDMDQSSKILDLKESEVPKIYKEIAYLKEKLNELSGKLLDAKSK